MLARIPSNMSLPNPPIIEPQVDAAEVAPVVDEAPIVQGAMVVNEARIVDGAPAAEDAAAARASAGGEGNAIARTDSGATLPGVAMQEDLDGAAARQFWLPNDAWRGITNFLDRDDILNLRATSMVINAQADQGITNVMLWKRDLAAFTNSPRFKHLRTLQLRNANDPCLHHLAEHLAARPRPGLTLQLSNRLQISAEGVARLMPLQLAGLSIAPSYGMDRRTLDTAVLDTLATCPFPVDLEADLSSEGLAAATRIASLRRLETFSPVENDNVARMFSAHPALQTLLIAKGTNLSSQGIEAFATIPTLRAFRVSRWNDAVFDVPAARALAAHPSLETFEIDGENNAGLSEDCFAALSQTQALTTLRVPLRPAMQQLANMTSLQNLVFNTAYRWQMHATLDLATAHSIAALPSLTSLGVGYTQFEAGALPIILSSSALDKLVFPNCYAFNDEDLSALLANTRLTALEFRLGTFPDDRMVTLCQHPTLERMRIGDAEYRRLPGQASLTLQAEAEW